MKNYKKVLNNPIWSKIIPTDMDINLLAKKISDLFTDYWTILLILSSPLSINGGIFSSIKITLNPIGLPHLFNIKSFVSKGKQYTGVYDNKLFKKWDREVRKMKSKLYFQPSLSLIEKDNIHDSLSDFWLWLDSNIYHYLMNLIPMQKDVENYLESKIKAWNAFLEAISELNSDISIRSVELHQLINAEYSAMFVLVIGYANEWDLIYLCYDKGEQNYWTKKDSSVLLLRITSLQHITIQEFNIRAKNWILLQDLKGKVRLLLRPTKNIEK